MNPMETAFAIVVTIALLLVVFGIVLPTYNARLTKKRERQFQALELARQQRVDAEVLASLPKYNSRFMREHR